MTTTQHAAHQPPRAAEPPLPRPLVLVRGFGGVDVGTEQRNVYQGFNDGTVYPKKRGENFLYEGFVLRALKSRRYRYSDATNVIGYYASAAPALPEPELHGWPAADTEGTVALDPGAAEAVLRDAAPGTIWIYRFYDLTPRSLDTYGAGLARLIHLIEHALVRQGREFTGVDVVAHSMGGLVVREALRQLHEDPKEPDSARRLVHKIVTLGTPHRGIAFQWLPKWLLAALPGANKASAELAAFDPDRTDFLQVGTWFDLDRILTVVGTNHAAYTAAASAANQLAAIVDSGPLAANRSDGLVQQAAAQLPGAPRTFIHKCHGGADSLVTSRESYEIAMRFFHGSHRVHLWLDGANVTGGLDMWGRSEIYLGVSVKPRMVDFSLFQQSPEAENCYGPFAKHDLSDELPDLRTELEKPLSAHGDRTTGWAGPDRLIWEGWFDKWATLDPSNPDLVFRLRIYVGERDAFGRGHSDDYIFLKDYYVQVIPGDPMQLLLHTGQDYLTEKSSLGKDELVALAHRNTEELGGAGPSPVVQAATRNADGDWTFPVSGTQFTATLRVRVSPA